MWTRCQFPRRCAPPLSRLFDGVVDLSRRAMSGAYCARPNPTTRCGSMRVPGVANWQPVRTRLWDDGRRAGFAYQHQLDDLQLAGSVAGTARSSGGCPSPCFRPTRRGAGPSCRETARRRPRRDPRGDRSGRARRPDPKSGRAPPAVSLLGGDSCGGHSKPTCSPVRKRWSGRTAEGIVVVETCSVRRGTFATPSRRGCCWR